MIATAVALASTAAFTFKQFSEHSYCAGSEERLCVLPGTGERVQPGSCFWYKSGLAGKKLVTSDIDGLPKVYGNAADMDASQKSQWPKHHWDPVAAGAVTANSFRRSAQLRKSCVENKHILVLGESTTRDLFFELAPAVGISVERGGHCMNRCTRVARSANNRTRLSFQFLSTGNNTNEIALTKHLIQDRKPDAVFLYCFMYDWVPSTFDEPAQYCPNRGKVPKDPDDYIGPACQEAANKRPLMGQACFNYLRQAVLSTAPYVPIYLLGPSFPPGWVEDYNNRTKTDSIMSRIFTTVCLPASLCPPSLRPHHGSDLTPRLHCFRSTMQQEYPARSIAARACTRSNHPEASSRSIDTTLVRNAGLPQLSRPRVASAIRPTDLAR